MSAKRNGTCLSSCKKLAAPKTWQLAGWDGSHESAVVDCTWPQGCKGAGRALAGHSIALGKTGEAAQLHTAPELSIYR